MSRWDKIKIFMDGRKEALNNMTIDGDIYLFGIWTGCSTKDIISHLEEKKMKYNKIYGFDSFTGLPEETEGVKKYHN
jgi:hypothetical protein